MLNKAIVFAIAAGFTTASFAQAPSPAATAIPSARVTSTTPAASVEKKAEAAARIGTVNADAPKAEASKSHHRHAKAKRHGKKTKTAKIRSQRGSRVAA